jgi:predicted NUDIX family NTP pyrophosphohydrolase
VRRESVGLLVHRRNAGELEFFLVHPGGPFWKSKDLGAWSIPKGELEEGEDPLAAARREFAEETGQRVAGDFLPLTPVRQAGGKTVRAWLLQAEVDAERIESNSFTMEWPPKSGRMASFPEVDRAAWFGLAEAREKILKGQRPLLDEAVRLLGLES